MAINITGPDPNASVWPVKSYPTKRLTAPGAANLTGAATDIIALNDSNDTTTIGVPSGSAISSSWRYVCAPFTIPAGARLTMKQPVVRARAQSGNTAKRDFMISQGDYSTGTQRDNLPNTHVQLIDSTIHQYVGANQVNNVAGVAATQTDISKGTFIVFGLNGVYSGQANNGQVVSAAYMQYAYDLPPTSNITFPGTGAPTINNTNSPIFTWDYFDDFQPQAAYQIQVLDNTSTVVYDSGKVTSSSTIHAMTSTLGNGTYTVQLMVWQTWNQAGGAFPSNSWSTATFTIAFLKLSTPRISAASSNEHIDLSVIPDVNLLSYDSSTFDNGTITWSARTAATIAPNGSTVKDGSGSMKVTVSAATAAVWQQVGANTCNPGDSFNAQVYVNPLALTARKAQVGLVWCDSTGATLSESDGTATTLTANTWNQITVSNATAPASAAYFRVVVNFTLMTAADVVYVDDAGVWWASGTTRVNLCTNPSLETNTTGWAGSGNPVPTIAQSSEQAFSGTKSVKATWAAGNVFFPNLAMPSFTCVVGKVYTCSVYVYVPTGNSSVNIYQSGGAFGQTSNVNDAWQRLYVTFTATSTTHTVGLRRADADTSAGKVFYADAALFEQTNVLLPYFDGSTAGAAWNGTANASTSTATATFPTWTRGGFFESTANLLNDADASVLDPNATIWNASPSLTATSVTVSNAQFARGSASLLLQRSVSGTGDIQANLGTNNYIAVTPATPIRLVASVFSSVARTCKFGVFFYNSNFTASATANLEWSVTSTAGAWQYNNTVTGTVPTDAAYVVPYCKVLAVAATTETHYFDTMMVSNPNTVCSTFQHGLYPNTDDSPTMLIEYSDNGGTSWLTLPRGQFAISYGTDHYAVKDYTAKDNITRTYRASMNELENSVQLQSDYSSTVTGQISINNVWLHAESNPEGTSYNFVWDGGGRAVTLGASPTLMDIEGLAYPFAQFSVKSNGSVQVTLYLDTFSDGVALSLIAQAKSTVVFRDGRGRSYRGVIGDVAFSDITSGTYTQSASFTLQFAGIQP